MNRRILPAALGIFLVTGSMTFVQQLSVPGLSPDVRAPDPDMSPKPCAYAPYPLESNCTQVLACVGDDGLWFRGRAFGWDTGNVSGQVSDGTKCDGTWTSGGLFGTGFSSLECTDQTSVTVIYHQQDSKTGTVIGTGRFSDGRNVAVWTGRHVLTFLTNEKNGLPMLPCGGDPIPIS